MKRDNIKDKRDQRITLDFHRPDRFYGSVIPPKAGHRHHFIMKSILFPFFAIFSFILCRFQYVRFRQSQDVVYKLLGYDTLFTPARVAKIRAAISRRYHEALENGEYGGTEGLDWVWQPLDQNDSSKGRYKQYIGNTWNPSGLLDEFRFLGAHPHAGALDELGWGGYVHDEKELRRKPPVFDFNIDKYYSSQSGKSAACDYFNNITYSRNLKRYVHDNLGNDYLGTGGYRMLTEQVKISKSHYKRNKEVRIFCAIYTIEEYHYRLKPIRETWGAKCDGFMAASTKTDTSLNAVNIPHFGPESYNSIWQKVRSIWSYIYKTYYDDYDFFYLGGDDYYLIVENLRDYLSSSEILYAGGGKGWPIPLYLGHRIHELQGGNKWQSNHGGAGYILNRAALAVLVELAFDLEYCEPYKMKHFEDKKVGGCLRNFTVTPYDTKDANKLERFHIISPQQLASGKLGQLMNWFKKTAHRNENYVFGFDTASPASISFHYVQPRLMKQIHTVLYGMCPKEKNQV
uniref:Hexosyltransferase n=1 Tax=Corethron hystrix TaxID=216773 RepID=A0A6U5DAC2_9STRA|mmetsp:Transcript_10928/g.24054  ORF Transcript_10928/g.24054 Transcript_10928/m.24054 type:complete len:514 (+) Transcript_10928:100-1641(+)